MSDPIVKIIRKENNIEQKKRSKQKSEDRCRKERKQQLCEQGEKMKRWKKRDGKREINSQSETEAQRE